MGYYLRKSVRLGPVRLNLSKSGIGVSFGVRGLRYGVRPDGRAYVHAGRYGLYYRQTLGTSPREPRRRYEDEPSTSAPALGATVLYDTAEAVQLAKRCGTELAGFLQRSYGWARLDYMGVFLAASLCAVSFLSSVGLGVLVGVLGIFGSWWVCRWEMRRRSVYVHYDLDAKALALCQCLTEGFNQLASSQGVWVLDASTHVATLQGFKAHAGASALVKRRTARVGEGSPPWMETNITVPMILARQQTLYFLPDGVLVYDRTGVAQVDYAHVRATAGTTRFIENSLPADAQVVDYTWLHPNINGGPDKRYARNYQIPVCLYGEIVLESPSGMYLRLQTSRHDVPSQFESALKGVSQSTAGKVTAFLRPSIEVNPEHFESLALAPYREAVHTVRWFDGLLRRIAGSENDIIYNFLRIFSALVALAGLVGIFYLVVRVIAG